MLVNNSQVQESLSAICFKTQLFAFIPHRYPYSPKHKTPYILYTYLNLGSFREEMGGHILE